MAIGAMQRLQEEGRRVPEEVSVVGYDDTEMCQIVAPNLTTVRQPLELMGELGAGEVLRQIEEEEKRSAIHTNLEPQLIVRESTAGITQ
jgi:LacI family transcriptional regulator